MDLISLLLVLVFAIVAVSILALALIKLVRHRWSKTRSGITAFAGLVPLIGLATLVPFSCFAVGCQSGARVVVSLEDLPDTPMRLRICVDKTEALCVNDTLESRPAAIEEDPWSVDPGEFCVADICVTPLHDRYIVDYNRLTGKTHKAKIQIDEVRKPEDFSRSGWSVQDERALALTKSTPNGKACGPTCWNGAVTFAPSAP